ncbi:unnamed protein product [Allacma fusca]|uniref:Uncharacterized protein n=1 Tax=Allacma fusca TaxID=39272 RepID=A0A8J2NXI7_9HEXA|nr:unnamed protein product [Allacma fusca]
MFQLKDLFINTVTPKPETWNLSFEYFVEQTFQDVGYAVPAVVVDSRSRCFDPSSFVGIDFPVRHERTSQYRTIDSETLTFKSVDNSKIEIYGAFYDVAGIKADGRQLPFYFQAPVSKFLVTNSI